MEAVTKEMSVQDRKRRELSNDGHVVVAQLLETPLPTPRRSSAVDAPVSLRGTPVDVSPQRGHVPFSWESSPGVAKSAATGGKDPEGLLPPAPAPGRCSGSTLCRARRENTSNDDESGEDGAFSDAQERLSSSDRLAALSARLSAVDGAAGSRRRSPSFLMDRFLPAANAIATTSVDKHPRPRRSSPRHSVRLRRSKDDDEEEVVARARHVMMNTPRSALAREQPKQRSPPRSAPVLEFSPSPER